MKIQVGPSSFPVPFEVLGQLTDDELDALTSLLREANFPVTPESRQRSKIMPLLRKELGETSGESWDEFFGFLTFVLTQSDDYDEFKEFVDACINKCGTDLIRDKAKTFFESFNFGEYFYNRRLGRYTVRANNYYTDINYACDLRGRFDQDFSYADTPIDGYEPKLIDLKPIVTLMIELNDGENEQRVWFQADANDLNEMIANLLAAQKELKILSESANRGSDGNKS